MDTTPNGNQDTNLKNMATEGGVPPTPPRSTVSEANVSQASANVSEPPPALPPHETATALPRLTPKAPPVKFTARGSDIVEIGAMLFQEAESILETGRKKQLKVRLGRKTIAEMPLATGALGVLASVMVAVALSRLTVEVE